MLTPTALTRFDGTKWDVIYGTNSTIFSLETYKDRLYIGGAFSQAGGMSVKGIASYYEAFDCNQLVTNYTQSVDSIEFQSDSVNVSFTNTSKIGTSWHWDFGDGDTSNVKNPIHYYTAPGIFNVSLIAKYQNCLDTAYSKVVIISTGKEKIKINNTQINIYPNPSDKNIVIETKQTVEKTLKIYNLAGSLIKEIQVSKLELQTNVDISEWEKGVYICELFIENKKIESCKFVVK
jgi:PKD repeat protein